MVGATERVVIRLLRQETRHRLLSTLPRWGIPPIGRGLIICRSLKKTNDQFVSNTDTVGLRCGLLVATRVPQVVEKTAVG